MPQKQAGSNIDPNWNVDELKLCPESGRILARYKILPDTEFYLDRCGHCNGIWFDKNEWDALVEHNLHDNVNEFFTRPLREGARPLDADPAAILSPADGKVEDAGAIDARGSFFIKGRPYALHELLGCRGEAARLAGGQFVVVYLSPRDYHRVHAPVTGEVVRARHVGGTLFPVNRIGVEHVPKLFAKNERVVVVQDHPAMGEVVTILVGALVVGGIGLAFDSSLVTREGAAGGETTYRAPRPSIPRGAELGWFELGSTAIVVIPASARAELAVTPGQPTRVGRAIAHARLGAVADA